MSIVVIIVSISVLGFIYLINSATNKSVKVLLDPEEVITILEPDSINEYEQEFGEFNEWAKENGFMPEVYFQFETMNPNAPIICGSWWSASTNTWALLYCTPALNNIDYVTIYSENIGVTTGSTKDSLMLPDVPKAYKQSFVNLALRELYEKHLIARGIVEEHESISLPLVKGNLMNQIEYSMIRQAEYIMSLPFWRIRGVLWYFVRRNILINKAISVQNA